MPTDSLRSFNEIINSNEYIEKLNKIANILLDLLVSSVKNMHIQYNC